MNGIEQDEELRAIAREIAEGVAGAEERYIVANRRRSPFNEALFRFLEKLNGALQRHYAIESPDMPELNARYGFATDPKSQSKFVKFVRVMRVEVERSRVVSRSAYCFVEKETGTILRTGTWSAPEPKRIPRGNIYALESLAGCGPHGVVYVAKGAQHANGSWAPGVFGPEATPIKPGPTLPTSRRS